MARRKKTVEAAGQGSVPAESSRATEGEPRDRSVGRAALESGEVSPGWRARAHDSINRQFLTFRVANDEYALGILAIREILEFDSVTRVPYAPSWVTGVMNLRGSVVPVVDVAIKFDLPKTAITKRTCIVVVDVSVDSEFVVMGMLVESVNRVVELAPDEIEAAPRFGTVADSGYLSGLGRVDGQFVPIIDVDRLLGTADTLAELPSGLPQPTRGGDGGAGDGEVEIR